MQLYIYYQIYYLIYHGLINLSLIYYLYTCVRARADNDYGYKSGFSGFCLLTK